MLGSDYRELIVPRADSEARSKAFLTGGSLLTAVLLLVSLGTGIFLLLLPVTAAAFATWYFWYHSRVEYEYVISGDELCITKIFSESKRKPLLTITFDKFTAFGSLQQAGEPGSRTLVLACRAQDDTAYYADFDHPQFGQTRLVMTPDDNILAYLEKHLPRTLGFRR